MMISVGWYSNSISGDQLESLDRIKTRFGTVEVREKDYEERTIHIKNKALPIKEFIISIEKKWEIGGRDVLLILTSDRSSFCPATYSFLILTARQAITSEQFGNCSDIPDVSKTGNSILVKFPRMNRNAPAETVEYDDKDGNIYGMISQVIGNKAVSKPGKLQLTTTPF